VEKRPRVWAILQHTEERLQLVAQRFQLEVKQINKEVMAEQIKATDSFLGTGWGFPVAFNNLSGDVRMTSDVEDILCSLNILLSTSIGERIMQPKFGCNLEDVMFEPISTSLLSFIKGLVKDAILYHEPRIRLNKIAIDTDDYLEGRLPIEIDFTISATNSRYNYVYPFYINEASSLNK
jgi:uncharacterized protein